MASRKGNDEQGQPLLNPQKVDDEIVEETYPKHTPKKDNKMRVDSYATDNSEQHLGVPPEEKQYRTQSDASDRSAEAGKAERRVFEVNQVFPKKDRARRFQSNKISTTKYSCLTFLPKNLFEQFTKMANAYFLLLTLLELIPAISDSNGKPVLLLPLSFVVGISMIKDIFEDRKRYVQDREENVQLTRSCPRGKDALKAVRSQDILVGQIVQVKENEMFPCDLLLLNSSIPKGICYVETKNLDGETNLKHKQADKSVLRLAKNEHDTLTNFNGAIIECETPNEFLYKFEGNLTMKDGAIVPLDVNQILMRGSSLRNTEWVTGIAVFTGHETKIMKNSARARPKKSKVEIITNAYIVMTIFIQGALCLTAALFNAFWQKLQGEEFSYFEFPAKGSPEFIPIYYQIFISFGTWFLALMNFVSISLLVTLEMVKFFQAMFISYDWMIFDVEKGMEAKVQSSNLNEELGMIHYIFSDKTGTLTQNIMEFKRFSAGQFSYGKNNPKKKEYEPGVTNVNFEDKAVFEQLKDKNAPNHELLFKLVESLGICHTIITEEKKTKTGEKYIAYNASSPDELALVNGARHLGFAFRERDEDGNMVIDMLNTGEVKKYKLLNLIEFDSARKRMTVVVKTPDDRILVVCKGADSIIEKRLKPNQKALKSTNQFLEDYATQGLRTLLIASKYIEEQEYISWSDKYNKALTSINRDKECNEVAELLEINFDLIGSTAIEDKLQDEVGKTIRDIKRAGVQLWVLTGDKVETAINIGYSCELLNNEMNMFILSELRPKKIRIELNQALAQQNITKKARDNAVVVAGDTLAAIQKDESLEKEFIDLCESANVVLACRVSPKQKAEVVKMIRVRNPKKSTLAIGDGANDVNMITAAHIGIGISGLEGQQAARAADYSIGQFRFLKNLLFCHGREAYRRNTYLISYMFYKNVLYVTPIWMYGFMSFFSGTIIYDTYLYQCYNIFFTGMPIIYFAVFDWEYPKEYFLKRPKLYMIGLEDVFFNPTVFWRWFFYAVWQGTLLLFLSFYTLDYSSNTQGSFGSLSTDGQFVFGCVVVVVNIKVLISSYQYTFWAVLFVILSVMAFYVAFAVLSMLKNYSLTGDFAQLYGFPETYFSLLFFMFAYVLVDSGLQLANAEVRRWMMVRKEMESVAELKSIQKDTTITRRRVTQFQNRGFAYSGEAGHDLLVTDSLSNRLQEALKRQLFSGAMFKPLASKGSIDGFEKSKSADELLSSSPGKNQLNKSDSEVDATSDESNPGLLALFKKHSGGMDLKELVKQKKEEELKKGMMDSVKEEDDGADDARGKEDGSIVSIQKGSMNSIEEQ